VCDREIETVCVCVIESVCERERYKVCGREIETVCVCVIVCVCEREGETEG